MNANASRRARQARKRGRRGPADSNRVWWIVGVVIAVVAIAVVVASAGTHKNKSTDLVRSPAPQSLVDKVAGVPDSAIKEVGLGSASLPQATGDAQASGTPEVLYIGAEYCPYCAAQRWAILNALSRFGTFSNLSITQSSSIDVFPRTPTFSFYKSAYTSKYLKFTPVELNTNEPSGGGYKELEKLTSEQEQQFQKFSPRRGVPFMLFAQKYVQQGPSYDVQVLQGKTRDEIADAMSDVSTEIAKGAVGSANALTAAICALTNDQPASACTPTIMALESQLG